MTQPVADEWTSWGEPAQEGPKRSVARILVPLIIVGFIIVALVAFVLLGSSASAAGGCGGG